MPGFCLMVVASSVIREMRSSSESTSHYHLQWSLDWTGLANVLTSEVTRPHTNGLPMEPHWNPDLLITSWFWRGSYCLYCWGSRTHQAATWHFWVYVSLCCIVVCCVSRLVAAHLNIYSKLVQNTFFFVTEYFSGFAWFPTLVNPIWQSIVLQGNIFNT